MKKRFSIFIMLIICLSLIPSQTTYANNNNEQEIKDYTIEQSGEYTLISYTLPSNQINPKVSSTSFTKYIEVYLDQIYICTYAVSITFTYSIPTTTGHIAQITSHSVNIIEHNGASPLVAKQSGITTSVENGSPAKLTINIPIYYRSNNVKHGTAVNTVFCYSSGSHS